MNKTKRVLSVVLAVLMLSSLIAALAIADEMYTVVINYVFEDNSKAAPEWVGTIYKGSAFKKDVKSPEVVGYTPNRSVVSFDIAAADRNVTETVVYKPAVVNYTVKHYQQNVDNDNYVLVETETKTGLTNSLISANLKKKYGGFTALNYNTDVNIAADGSTIVEIKYDRNYYMLSLNLDGGYGVEPIYARYGAAITLGEPTKAGYTFTGWDKSVPTTMPANDVTLTAQWKVDDRADYLVQYWLENANDNDYSYDSSVTKNAAPGTVITKVDDKSYTGFKYDHTDGATVAADGSSVVNVYYKRNTYTLTFKVDEGFVFTKWVTKAEFKNVKYGEDTTKYWNQAPSGYLWYTTKSGDTFYTAAPDMPNNNLTIYGKTSSGTSTIHYYEKGTTTSIRPDLTVRESGWTFTEEDYIKIPGFTYSSNSKKDNDYYLYYTRNSYKLDFNNANVIVKSETIPYEKALSGYNFTPDYPAKLEAGAYKFDGWYTDPGCTSAVDWANAKMPYKNMVVYAKWAPVVHTVTFAKTEGAEAEATQQVNHNELAQGYTTTNGSYTFIGWFYKDANGVEHAFDLSMPVEHDMNLYAKWRTDVLVNYIIHYQLADGTKVADDTIGSAFVLETKTFEAKVGDALYADYAEGYFPNLPSHSIKMENNQANVFAFVYAPADKVTYTVKYLEKGKNTQLRDSKTMETTKAVVTEIFEPVDGYAVDEYQKRLILTAGEGATNEIIFWYTKDNVHAPVTIIHWTQNIEGEGYTQYQTSTEQGTIGKNYKAEWTTIEGFHKNVGKSNVEGKLEDYKGLVLNLYYDRDMITYKFHFVDNVTGEQIANDIQGEARYGKTVSQEALRIDGYKLANGTPDLKAITVGTVSAANEFTFYYIGYFNVVHVKDGGTNKNTTEVDYTQSVIDNGYNLTAAVTTGYLYGGAFDDEKCETVYNFGQENAINFTPVKGETYYIWEVSETYLKPRAYVVSRHDPDNNGGYNVVGLYLTSSVDRNMYSEVGFTVDGTNFASDGGKVYDKVQAVYTDGSGVKEEMYVMADGVWDVQALAPDSRGGYVSICTVSMNTFYKKSAESPLSYQPYWVTLDGIKVTGAYAARTCYYQGVGNGDIGISNCVDSDSAVSIYRAATTNTIGVESVAVLSAAPETVQPEVPVTPEIPEVPEAPEMTLNSGAMYLRAQYTYEMMTNTVKFISAIDVNECTEYGFVINGEVVKCEE
ncbi:MAG: InlB B-repeat-containing protein, partial [Eubacteriales bacterium]|nr:InlB B-repeat-containing protein [Christensenellaceae bacterium]MDY5719507.1 InlB B-repeat-containing protein [Eubacteriales bacterium]